MKYYRVQFTGATGAVWCRKMKLRQDDVAPDTAEVLRYFGADLIGSEITAIRHNRVLIGEMTKAQYDKAQNIW